MSRAVWPVCSSDMAALTARANSQQGAECIWDVIHDCLLSLYRVILSAVYLRRSILCNSTNMPFGGTGGSADTGGHVGGMGAGNGARTGTAKGAARLASQGAFLQAPERSWGMLGEVPAAQCRALTCPGEFERQTGEHSAMWIIGDLLCRHHRHRHHWHHWHNRHRHDRNPHRHNWRPHGHRRDYYWPDCHRWRQCSPDCVMIPCALSAPADRCPLQAPLAACDLRTAPACAGSSPQQVSARPCPVPPDLKEPGTAGQL